MGNRNRYQTNQKNIRKTMKKTKKNYDIATTTTKIIRFHYKKR